MRVIVDKDEEGRDKLGFEYLDGPVTPKPEKMPVAARPKPSAALASGRSRKATAKRGSVPKVPLVKV